VEFRAAGRDKICLVKRAVFVIFGDYIGKSH
jgi:hypothetical protein